MNNYQDRIKLGQRITEMREANNLTIEELARRADINPGHLERIELGKYNVRLDQLSNIAKALNKSISLI